MGSADNQEQTHNALRPLHICHALSADREYFGLVELKENLHIVALYKLLVDVCRGYITTIDHDANRKLCMLQSNSDMYLVRWAWGGTYDAGKHLVDNLDLITPRDYMVGR